MHLEQAEWGLDAPLGVHLTDMHSKKTKSQVVRMPVDNELLDGKWGDDDDTALPIEAASKRGHQHQQ